VTIRGLHHIIPEVSNTTIHEAVTEKLGYTKLCARWMPKGQAEKFYDSGIYKLVPRLSKCLDNAVEYAEK